MTYHAEKRICYSEVIMANILRFPISIIRDGEIHQNWKRFSSKKEMPMEKFAIEAIKEKCERIKNEEEK